MSNPTPTPSSQPHLASSPTFDMIRAANHAFFLSTSLDALHQAMDDEAADAPIAARSHVSNLMIIAYQLARALQEEDSAHLMPSTLKEVE